jgi:transcriptional regulator with XRE-family HTH domain
MDNKQPVNTGDPLNAAVAKVLRLAQTEMDISDVALAQRADVKVATLRRWLDDKRPLPASPFVRIAEALDVDPTEVIRRARLRLAE